LKQLKLNKKIQLKEERKNTLKKVLSDNKLELKEYGDCYSYIHTGYPEPSAIIETELVQNQEKNKRRIELAQHLSNKNIMYDESIDYCRDYVYNIGFRSLQETIRMVEMEQFLLTKTEYKKYIPLYDKQIAREMAIRQYYKHISDPDNDNDYVSIVVDFNI
jgi:hypothetical protein